MMRGNMPGAPVPGNISAQLHDTAERAASYPEMSFNSISHRTDTDLLHEAYRQTRKDGASGVDGVTAEEYAADPENNLKNLHERLKTGRHKTPPVRRVWTDYDAYVRLPSCPHHNHVFRELQWF
jgi:hypothetical protein